MPQGTIKIFAIDPDNNNGNLNRTKKALEEYKRLKNLNIGTGTPLFSTNLEKVIDDFPWSPVTQNQTLSSLVKYTPHENTAASRLYAALYTKKERNESLNEGFRGHPSIGAAAFTQQHIQNDAWNTFVDDIKTSASQQVKIFLAGSIFGGTGAAGIPTISRLLKSGIPANLRANISIGGVLILPYFNFSGNNGQADGQLFANDRNFLMNTKAAVMYYSQLKDSAFDSMYFVGDSASRSENFSTGSSDQENNAHIVDLYAALAAASFFHNGATAKFNVAYHNDNYKFTWSDFPMPANDSQERFVQFARFIFAYVYLIQPHLDRLIAEASDKNKLTDNIKAHPWFSRLAGNIGADAQNFGRYTEYFVAWLKQLETLDGREIQLIKSYMIAAHPCRITDETALKNNFGALGYTTDNLTIEGVNTAICDDGRSFWERIRDILRGGNRNTLDFGQFLRRLYDACKVRK